MKQTGSPMPRRAAKAFAQVRESVRKMRPVLGLDRPEERMDSRFAAEVTWYNGGTQETS